MVQFKLNDVEYCCEITGMTLVDAKRCGIAIKSLMGGVISAIRSAGEGDSIVAAPEIAEVIPELLEFFAVACGQAGRIRDFLREIKAEDLPDCLQILMNEGMRAFDTGDTASGARAESSADADPFGQQNG